MVVTDHRRFPDKQITTSNTARPTAWEQHNFRSKDGVLRRSRLQAAEPAQRQHGACKPASGGARHNTPARQGTRIYARIYDSGSRQAWRARAGTGRAVSRRRRWSCRQECLPVSSGIVSEREQSLVWTTGFLRIAVSQRHHPWFGTVSGSASSSVG